MLIILLAILTFVIKFIVYSIIIISTLIGLFFLTFVFINIKNFKEVKKFFWHSQK